MKDFFSLLILFVLIGVPNISYANVAPVKIPGQTLIPLDQNEMRATLTEAVEMTAEEVILDISLLKDPVFKTDDSSDYFVRASSEAHVTASFTLTNTSRKNIGDFYIGFPFGTAGYDFQNQSVELAQLRNLHVFVENQEVTFEKRDHIPKNEYVTDVGSVPWAVWTMDFGKAGSQSAARNIKLTYDIYSSDSNNEAILLSEYNIPLPDSLPGSALFYYILHTGSGWKGNIGSTIVRIRFPDEIPLAREEFQDEKKNNVYQTWDIVPTAFTIDEEKHEIVWRFINWEPNIPTQPFYGFPTEDASNPNIMVQFPYPQTLAVLKEYFSVSSATPLEELATSSSQQQAQDKTANDDANKDQNVIWFIGALVIGFSVLFVQKISNAKEEKH